MLFFPLNLQAWHYKLRGHLYHRHLELQTPDDYNLYPIIMLCNDGVNMVPAMSFLPPTCFELWNGGYCHRNCRFKSYLRTLINCSMPKAHPIYLGINLRRRTLWWIKFTGLIPPLFIIR